MTTIEKKTEIKERITSTKVEDRVIKTEERIIKKPRLMIETTLPETKKEIDGGKETNNDITQIGNFNQGNDDNNDFKWDSSRNAYLQLEEYLDGRTEDNKNAQLDYIHQQVQKHLANRNRDNNKVDQNCENNNSAQQDDGNDNSIQQGNNNNNDFKPDGDKMLYLQYEECSDNQAQDNNRVERDDGDNNNIEQGNSMHYRELAPTYLEVEEYLEATGGPTAEEFGECMLNDGYDDAHNDGYEDAYNSGEYGDYRDYLE